MTRPEPRNATETSVYYTPTTRYWLYAAAGGAIALLFGWELLVTLRQPSTLSSLLERLLFLLVGVGLLGWGLYTALGRLLLTSESVVWKRAAGAPKVVHFRQLINASEAGRFGGSVTLLYHPLQQDGLLDLEDARTLFLPALRHQDELLAHLQEKIPT